MLFLARGEGLPVAAAQTVRNPSSGVALALGPWPSGLYYAGVTTPGRGAWYAPFVLRPQQLGVHRVLIVLPTNTWQAYNFEDNDSWYENADVHTVDSAAVHRVACRRTITATTGLHPVAAEPQGSGLSRTTTTASPPAPGSHTRTT
jgi:hypothetical protein